MKSKLAVVILGTLVSNVYAQTNNKNAATKKSVATISDESSAKSADKSVELELGYASRDVESDDKSPDADEIKGKGISGRFGKSFNLAPSVNTTTSVNATYLKIDTDAIAKEEPGLSFNSNMGEIGLSQRLSFDTGESVIVRPYMELGAAIGVISIEAKDKTNKNNSAKVDMNYTKYGGAVGLQFVVDQTIVPYLSYDYSRMMMNKNAKIESKVNGATTSKVEAVDGERGATSQTLSLGIGFLF